MADDDVAEVVEGDDDVVEVVEVDDDVVEAEDDVGAHDVAEDEGALQYQKSIHTNKKNTHCVGIN